MQRIKFSVQPHAGQVADLHWMQLALAQAQLAAAQGEVPIGAVVALNGQLLAAACNAPISKNNACAHAEILAIEQACNALGNYRLGSQSTLYVTLQPCLMCLGAILHARVGRVVIGADQSRYSGHLSEVLAVFEQSPAWHSCCFETGCMAQECASVLTEFFQARRKPCE